MFSIDNSPSDLGKSLKKKNQKPALPAQATHLGEHAGAPRHPGGLVRHTVDAHGLAVTGELQGEFFAPHVLDDMVADGAELALVQPTLVGVVEVEFLSQHSQGCLCCLAHFLINVLSLGMRINN